MTQHATLPRKPVIKTVSAGYHLVEWYLNSCPKCGGDRFRDKEFTGLEYGYALICLNCGGRE